MACLGDRGAEGVENARILVLAGEALEAVIELQGITFCELGDRADTEKMEIAFDRRAHGNEVPKLTG
jgi:hypothetical protein